MSCKNSAQVRLYDFTNIDSLPWPDNENGRYAKDYLIPFIKNGPDNYIENVKTEMMVLKVDNLVLPITVNESEYDNSYVCSPYGQYVQYPKELIAEFPKTIRSLMKMSLALKGRILKWGEVNKVVSVNNWLVSTNLYPKITKEQFQKILSFLKKQFPRHAILFRSVDDFINKDHLTSLKDNGCQAFGSRYVYFLDPNSETCYQSRQFKSDLRLLKNSNYEVIDAKDLTSTDFPRLLELYKSVYINKYSSLNQKLNLQYIELALNKKLLHIKVLKKKDSIDGVIGYFYRDGVVAMPFFGYDTTKSVKGLYRIASTVMTLEAKELGMTYNLSAGGSFYKKTRKAVGYMEYTAVAYDHLPLKQKIAWGLLKEVINRFGTSFIKNY